MICALAICTFGYANCGAHGLVNACRALRTNTLHSPNFWRINVFHNLLIRGRCAVLSRLSMRFRTHDSAVHLYINNAGQTVVHLSQNALIIDNAHVRSDAGVMHGLRNAFRSRGGHLPCRIRKPLGAIDHGSFQYWLVPRNESLSTPEELNSFVSFDDDDARSNNNAEMARIAVLTLFFARRMQCAIDEPTCRAMLSFLGNNSPRVLRLLACANYALESSSSRIAPSWLGFAIRSFYFDQLILQSEEEQPLLPPFKQSFFNPLTAICSMQKRAWRFAEIGLSEDDYVRYLAFLATTLAREHKFTAPFKRALVAILSRNSTRRYIVPIVRQFCTSPVRRRALADCLGDVIVRNLSVMLDDDDDNDDDDDDDRSDGSNITVVWLFTRLFENTPLCLHDFEWSVFSTLLSADNASLHVPLTALLAKHVQSQEQVAKLAATLADTSEDFSLRAQQLDEDRNRLERARRRLRRAVRKKRLPRTVGQSNRRRPLSHELPPPSPKRSAETTVSSVAKKPRDNDDDEEEEE